MDYKLDWVVALLIWIAIILVAIYFGILDISHALNRIADNMR